VESGVPGRNFSVRTPGITRYARKDVERVPSVVSLETESTRVAESAGRNHRPDER